LFASHYAWILPALPAFATFLIDLIQINLLQYTSILSPLEQRSGIALSFLRDQRGNKWAQSLAVAFVFFRKACLILVIILFRTVRNLSRVDDSL